MDKKIKCTNCGGTNMVCCRISSEGGGDCVSVSNADTYACTECGHVEFFLQESEIQKIHVRNENQRKYEDQTKEYEQKKTKLQKEIDDLRKIIMDENQTVKTVNESKKKIVDLENQLRTLHKPTNNQLFPWER